MKSIYLTLPSNVQSENLNFISSYVTRLPYDLQTVDALVGLREISLLQSLDNVHSVRQTRYYLLARTAISGNSPDFLYIGGIRENSPFIGSHAAKPIDGTSSRGKLTIPDISIKAPPPLLHSNSADNRNGGD